MTQSLFVGESRNRGTIGGQNKYWGVGGIDGKIRTLPRNRWGGGGRKKWECNESWKGLFKILRPKSKSNLSFLRNFKEWGCQRNVGWENKEIRARQSDCWADGQIKVLQALLAQSKTVKGSVLTQIFSVVYEKLVSSLTAVCRKEMPCAHFSYIRGKGILSLPSEHSSFQIQLDVAASGAFRWYM